MDEIRPTMIKKGTTLGANCTVVCMKPLKVTGSGVEYIFTKLILIYTVEHV